MRVREFEFLHRPYTLFFVHGKIFIPEFALYSPESPSCRDGISCASVCVCVFGNLVSVLVRGNGCREGEQMRRSREGVGGPLLTFKVCRESPKSSRVPDLPQSTAHIHLCEPLAFCPFSLLSPDP